MTIKKKLALIAVLVLAFSFIVIGLAINKAYSENVANNHAQKLNIL
ncbi:MAG: hypothetical protein L3I99_07175 [Sulfurimonas sp.]|nr:hypothetical protein [Sulfurimonas sp.]